MLYDVRRHRCGKDSDPQEQAYDMHIALATAAGYFGGYTSKMQLIGQREVRLLGQCLKRKLEVERKSPQAAEFQKYSKRLVRDLDGKGIY